MLLPCVRTDWAVMPPNLARPWYVALGRALYLWLLSRNSIVHRDWGRTIGVLILLIEYAWFVAMYYYVWKQQYVFHLVRHPYISLRRDSNSGPSTPNDFWAYDAHLFSTLIWHSIWSHDYNVKFVYFNRCLDEEKVCLFYFKTQWGL